MAVASDDRQTMTDALGARAVGTALALFLYYPLALWIFQTDHVTRHCALLLGLSLFWAPFDAVDLMFQGRLRARHGARVRAMVAFFGLALRLGFVYAGAPIYAFAAAAVLEATLQGALLLCIGSLTITEMRRGLSRSINSWLEALRKGLPLAIAAVCVIAYSKVDQVLVLRWAGQSEAGFYSSSLRLLEYINTLPMILAATTLPAIARTVRAHTQEGGAPSWYGPVALAAIIFTALVALLITAFPGVLIGFFFGSQYAPAVPVLRIAVLTTPLMCLGVLRHGFLVSRGSYGTVLGLEVMSAFCALGLNTWLIPSHGAVGGAWALLATALVVNALMSVISREVRAFWVALRF
jgi:O-antigen/teichoic acid export membrane protein